MKKYKLTDDTKEVLGRTLHRIVAVKDFAVIRAGTLGGYVEKESNLSHEGDCWIADDAMVYHDARVLDNAYVSDKAEVFGDAVLHSNVIVADRAMVYGKVKLYDDVVVCENATVAGNFEIHGSITIDGETWIQ